MAETLTACQFLSGEKKKTMSEPSAATAGAAAA
jgi:hypothetical protein